jgi:hypothetical protein
MAQEATSTPSSEGQAPEAGEGQAPNETDANSAPPAEETPTPKTFDEDYVKGLRREASTLRSRATDAEKRLRALEDRDKTDGEKQAERVTASERRATEAEAKLLRYEVARDRKLDARAAAFLTGTTREELEASADELSSYISEHAKPAAPSFDGGTRETPAEKQSPEKAHNDLLLRAFGRPPAS